MYGGLPGQLQGSVTTGGVRVTTMRDQVALVRTDPIPRFRDAGMQQSQRTGKKSHCFGKARYCSREKPCRNCSAETPICMALRLRDRRRRGLYAD